MKAEEIARKSLKVASDICVFTNNNVTMEKFKCQNQKNKSQTC